jgi:hypothetical protein
LERAKGIEPSYAAWEAAVLPLNYARASDRTKSPCLQPGLPKNQMQARLRANNACKRAVNQ